MKEEEITFETIGISDKKIEEIRKWYNELKDEHKVFVRFIMAEQFHKGYKCAVDNENL